MTLWIFAVVVLRVIYIYIYIYIYIIWLNIIDIFCLHIFLLTLSNWRIDLMIFGKNWLISMISYFQSTFFPTLGHHQGRIYYKSDVRLYFKVLLYLWAAGSWSLKYVYFGRISSLIHIWLNIIDIFCVHIFLLILLNCWIMEFNDDGPKLGRKFLGNN